jgi:hypothetical protein
MRRLRFRFGLALSIISASALSVTPALAGPEQNPNARTITLTCPFGEVTGTALGGSALILESGGVVVLQGATTPQGDVLVPINPGLAAIGKLVQCTYFSELRQEQVVAYFLIP